MHQAVTRRVRLRRFPGFLLAAVLLPLAVLLAFAVPSIPGQASPVRATQPLVLHVAGADPACDDARTRDEAASAATPWCTVGRAGAAAMPGDTVAVAAARYPPARLLESGSPGAPIRFRAAPGAVLDARGADTSLRLIGVHDLVVDGFTVTGAARQGVWVESSAIIVLSHLTVSGNAGTGVQLKGTTRVALRRSRVADNARAGVSELAGTRSTRLVGDVVTGNGHDGQAYGGDGIELAGRGALVEGSTITGNGDSPLFEHGIYAAARASAYVLRDNRLSGNAGADIKASGTGTVVGNRLGDARMGIVLSDNRAAVQVRDNRITGRFTHAVFLTAGATPARAALSGNEIRLTAPAEPAGDASAVFVNAAAALSLHGNTVCYAATDGRGVDLALPAPDRVSALRADGNRYCLAPGGRPPFVLGARRLDLPGWQAATGQDAHSIVVAG